MVREGRGGGLVAAAGYKVVIYDCDGVMFDSFEANLEFYQRIMAMMGQLPLSRDNDEQMRILHTYANREVLAHFFPRKEEWEESLRCAARIDYRELIPLMVMEQGLTETLEALRPHVSLAVCTNRSTSMGTVLESFGLQTYFQVVMTASRVANPKPHPDPLEAILRELGLSPREALFIGDSDVDRRAAEAAGVPFVAYRAQLSALACIERHDEVIPFVTG
jgi:HAD superfamily hydrolase (TIGR01509 family)